MDICNQGYAGARLNTPQAPAHGLNLPGPASRGNPMRDAHFGGPSHGRSVPGDPVRGIEGPALLGSPAAVLMPWREPEPASRGGDGGTVPQAPRARPLLSFMSQLQDHGSPGTERDPPPAQPRGPNAASRGLVINTTAGLSNGSTAGSNDHRRGGNSWQGVLLPQSPELDPAARDPFFLLNPAEIANVAMHQNDSTGEATPCAGPDSQGPSQRRPTTWLPPYKSTGGPPRAGGTPVGYQQEQELRNPIAHGRGVAAGQGLGAAPRGTLGASWGDQWGDHGPGDAGSAHVSGYGGLASGGGTFQGRQGQAQPPAAALVPDASRGSRGGGLMGWGFNKENQQSGGLLARAHGEKAGPGERGNGVRHGDWGVGGAARGVASPPPPAIDDVNLLSTGLWTP